ncbi:MAG TPA: hypothetical protein VFR10_03700, partial [bacterium]|nr:hypothetical protein [bacterium]
PHWVVVLIGINDRWNEARPADAAAIPAEPNAWVWRWRTKRLVQIAWANLRGNPGGSSPPTSAPQGAPDSAAIAARSAPDSTSPANLPSSVATLPPFPAGTDTVSVLRRRLLEVVQADTSKYATPEQRKQVFDIAEEARRLDNEELSIAVVEAYAQLKMHTFAVDEGEAALKTFGESPRLTRALVFPLQRTHQEEKALHFAERSVALDSTDAENWRVLASARFVIPDPKGGLLALLEFVKRGGDDAVVARQIRVRNLATTISLQELEQTIQDAGLDQQNAAKVKQLFGAMGDAAETEGELFQHLRAIAAQIKAQGARPLFLNYPTPGALAPAAQNESIARVAQKEGIPYLDLHLLLEQETAGQPRDDFFIADGHCTDRGYDIVAKAVAAKLIELDGQTPSS